MIFLHGFPTWLTLLKDQFQQSIKNKSFSKCWYVLDTPGVIQQQCISEKVQRIAAVKVYVFLLNFLTKQFLVPKPKQRVRVKKTVKPSAKHMKRRLYYFTLFHSHHCNVLMWPFHISNMRTSSQCHLKCTFFFVFFITEMAEDSILFW